MMKRWLVWTLAVCVTAGCGAADRSETSPSPQSNPDRQFEARQHAAQPDDSVVLHLERLASAVPGVERAHCVVLGNTAIVGVDVDERLERARVGTIKYSVAEALSHDPYGVNAIVTADMDIAQRLREIRADIGRGRPVTGFAEELADIIGRIVPQMPRDTIPDGQPPEEQAGSGTMDEPS